MSLKQPIRIAILGATGRQGRRRAEAITRVPGLAVGRLADIPEAAASLQDLAGRYACDTSTDWEEAISDDQIDAVVICTPNSRHAEMALGALIRGKHVLVEKPLSDSLEDTAKVATEAEQAGLTLRVGFNYPFREPIRHGLQHFLNGQIGPLLGFRGVISHSQFVEPDSRGKWFCRPELAGHGAWLDLGIHLVDLAHLAVASADDEFASVVAHTADSRVICTEDGRGLLEEECVALYRTEGGRLVSIHASWVEARPFMGARIELIGETGRVDIDLGLRTTRLITRRGGKVTETAQEFAYVDPDPSWTAEMELFRDMIAAGPHSELAGDGSVKVHRLAFAAYESARLGGQPVSLADTAGREDLAVLQKLQS